MKFGDRITITGKLRRSGEYVGHNFGWKKFWITRELKQPISGCLFLGYRNLSDGKVINNGKDGLEYQAEKYFKAALICVSERRKPIYVALESIIEVPENLTHYEGEDCEGHY